ncbi:MAG: PLDc N-terminal domain-containing protein, partial [Clostridia bacterium]|nr:PLDc N-terminal domain-containing protein [Clostridia bacterium]
MAKRRVTMETTVKRVLFSRSFILILLLLLQLAALLFLPIRQLTVYNLISGVMIVLIVNRRAPVDFKLLWVIPVAVLPVFGTLLYLWFSLQPSGLRMRSRSQRLDRHRLPEKCVPADGLARYLDLMGYPSYDQSHITYYPWGAELIEAMLEAMEGARQHIFLQYFIIAEGEVWDRVLEVCRRKAAEGVEVWLLMDGLGTLGRLPADFLRQMEAAGIRCQVFAPLRAVPSLLQNNRMHRKILVVDGEVGFTGGVNLADEYANLSVPHVWKDGGIRVEGDAVQGLSAIFLHTWALYDNEADSRLKGAAEKYLSSPPAAHPAGCAVPFADSPFDTADIGKRVYLDLIHTATRYVHI